MLVPGDIVRMRSGDFVPADAKIIGGNVEVDKSALTGESLPVEVLEGGMLYSGSVIRKGESSCLVVSTGLGTYFGKTVRLVQIAKPKMHSEEFTSRIVKVLLAMAGVLYRGAGRILYAEGRLCIRIAAVHHAPSLSHTCGIARNVLNNNGTGIA